MKAQAVVTITRDDLVSGIYLPERDPDAPKGDPPCFYCAHGSGLPNRAVARVATGMPRSPNPVVLMCKPHLDEQLDWADDGEWPEPLSIEWLP